MSELRNFPFKNQLNSPTLDHQPDENRTMNCVQTCIAAGLQWYTGREFEPDQVKDATFGQGYTGGTAAIGDVTYCAKQGVKLYAISGDPNFLIQQARKHLAQQHPVICTIPSNGQPPANRYDPGASHVVVFYKDSPGVLVAMNPWNAWSQANSDVWWSNRFCYGQIWIMERGTMSGIPQGWKDDGKTLVAPNGQGVVMGFRAWVLAHDWNPGNQPLGPEYHTDSVLIHNPLVGAGDVQMFRDSMLWWTQKTGVIQEPFMGMEIDADAKMIAALQAQVKDLQDKLNHQPAPNPTLKSDLVSVDQALQAVIMKVVG